MNATNRVPVPLWVRYVWAEWGDQGRWERQDANLAAGAIGGIVVVVALVGHGGDCLSLRLV